MPYRIVLAPDALSGDILLPWAEVLPVSRALRHEESGTQSNEHCNETFEEEDVAPANKRSQPPEHRFGEGI